MLHPVRHTTTRESLNSLVVVVKTKIIYQAKSAFAIFAFGFFR